jgi:DNA-binding transcriptional ArsR family regulator
MNRLEIVNLYLKDTFEFLEENEFFYVVCNEDGVDDIKKFKELFLYELEIKVLDAYDKQNSPNLTEEEFIEAMKLAIVEYHLEALKDKGLIQTELDPESGKMVYSLNKDISLDSDGGYGMYDH